MTTATATETETVAFESKTADLVLTRRPVRYGDDGFGGRIAITEDVWRARAEDEGKDISEELPWKIEFENGRFETDNPKLMAWLRSRSTYNSNESSGFYEVIPSPDELKPTSAEVLRSIGRAEANADVDDGVIELLAIREQETQTHNRPALIKASEDAIQMITGPAEPAGDAGAGNGDSRSTSSP